MSHLSVRAMRALSMIGAWSTDGIDWDRFVDVASWNGSKWWKRRPYPFHESDEVLPPEHAIMRIKRVGPATRDELMAAAWTAAFRRLSP